MPPRKDKPGQHSIPRNTHIIHKYHRNGCPGSRAYHQAPNVPSLESLMGAVSTLAHPVYSSTRADGTPDGVAFLQRPGRCGDGRRPAVATVPGAARRWRGHMARRPQLRCWALGAALRQHAARTYAPPSPSASPAPSFDLLSPDESVSLESILWQASYDSEEYEDSEEEYEDATDEEGDEQANYNAKRTPNEPGNEVVHSRGKIMEMSSNHKMASYPKATASNASTSMKYCAASQEGGKEQRESARPQEALPLFTDVAVSFRDGQRTRHLRISEWRVDGDGKITLSCSLSRLKAADSIRGLADETRGEKPTKLQSQESDTGVIKKTHLAEAPPSPCDANPLQQWTQFQFSPTHTLAPFLTYSATTALLPQNPPSAPLPEISLPAPVAIHKDASSRVTNDATARARTVLTKNQETLVPDADLLSDDQWRNPTSLEDLLSVFRSHAIPCARKGGRRERTLPRVRSRHRHRAHRRPRSLLNLLALTMRLQAVHLAQSVAAAAEAGAWAGARSSEGDAPSWGAGGDASSAESSAVSTPPLTPPGSPGPGYQRRRRSPVARSTNVLSDACSRSSRSPGPARVPAAPGTPSPGAVVCVVMDDSGSPLVETELLAENGSPKGVDSHPTDATPWSATWAHLSKLIKPFTPYNSYEEGTANSTSDHAWQEEDETGEEITFGEKAVDETVHGLANEWNTTKRKTNAFMKVKAVAEAQARRMAEAKESEEIIFSNKNIWVIAEEDPETSPRMVTSPKAEEASAKLQNSAENKHITSVQFSDETGKREEENNKIQDYMMLKGKHEDKTRGSDLTKSIRQPQQILKAETDDDAKNKTKVKQEPVNQKEDDGKDKRKRDRDTNLKTKNEDANNTAEDNTKTKTRQTEMKPNMGTAEELKKKIRIENKDRATKATLEPKVKAQIKPKVETKEKAKYSSGFNVKFISKEAENANLKSNVKLKPETNLKIKEKSKDVEVRVKVSPRKQITQTPPKLVSEVCSKVFSDAETKAETVAKAREDAILMVKARLKSKATRKTAKSAAEVKTSNDSEKQKAPGPTVAKQRAKAEPAPPHAAAWLEAEKEMDVIQHAGVEAAEKVRLAAEAQTAAAAAEARAKALGLLWARAAAVAKANAACATPKCTAVETARLRARAKSKARVKASVRAMVRARGKRRRRQGTALSREDVSTQDDETETETEKEEEEEEKDVEKKLQLAQEQAATWRAEIAAQELPKKQAKAKAEDENRALAVKRARLAAVEMAIAQIRAKRAKAVAKVKVKLKTRARAQVRTRARVKAKTAAQPEEATAGLTDAELWEKARVETETSPPPPRRPRRRSLESPKVIVSLCDGRGNWPLDISQWHVTDKGQLVLNCTMSKHDCLSPSPSLRSTERRVTFAASTDNIENIVSVSPLTGFTKRTPAGQSALKPILKNAMSIFSSTRTALTLETPSLSTIATPPICVPVGIPTPAPKETPLAKSVSTTEESESVVKVTWLDTRLATSVATATKEMEMVDTSTSMTPDNSLTTLKSTSTLTTLSKSVTEKLTPEAPPAPTSWLSLTSKIRWALRRAAIGGCCTSMASPSSSITSTSKRFTSRSEKKKSTCLMPILTTTHLDTPQTDDKVISTTPIETSKSKKTTPEISIKTPEASDKTKRKPSTKSDSISAPVVPKHKKELPEQIPVAPEQEPAPSKPKTDSESHLPSNIKHVPEEQFEPIGEFTESSRQYPVLPEQGPTSPQKCAMSPGQYPITPGQHPIPSGQSPVPPEQYPIPTQAKPRAKKQEPPKLATPSGVPKRGKPMTPPIIPPNIPSEEAIDSQKLPKKFERPLHVRPPQPPPIVLSKGKSTNSTSRPSSKTRKPQSRKETSSAHRRSGQRQTPLQEKPQQQMPHQQIHYHQSPQQRVPHQQTHHRNYYHQTHHPTHNQTHHQSHPQTPHQTPHHQTPHHQAPHHQTPHHQMPHHQMPHHQMPHHQMPHHQMPHQMYHHQMAHHQTPHQQLPHNQMSPQRYRRHSFTPSARRYRETSSILLSPASVTSTSTAAPSPTLSLKKIDDSSRMGVKRGASIPPTGKPRHGAPIVMLKMPQPIKETPGTSPQTSRIVMGRPTQKVSDTKEIISAIPQRPTSHPIARVAENSRTTMLPPLPRSPPPPPPPPPPSPTFLPIKKGKRRAG